MNPIRLKAALLGLLGLLAMLIIGIVHVSAAGLTVVNASSVYDFNKSTTEVNTFTLQIRNDEAFTFYNITFETNPHVAIPKIAELPSGSVATVTANVTATTNINQAFRIKGLYQTLIGQTDPITKDVFVNFNAGSNSYSVDQCVVSMPKGSTVIFHNAAPVTLTLLQWPGNTPIGVGTISTGNTINSTFTTPQTLDYYFSVASFPVTQICRVNVLDNTGLVNDPAHDALINVSVKILAEPTTISMSIPQTAYNISYGGSNGGALTISNTGSKEAKDVTLSGDWFSFSENRFNLAAGQTKGITFTITPTGLTTDQTNRTHSKILNLAGNFDAQAVNFSIFIPKATIIGENTTDVCLGGLNTECLEYYHNVYCPAHPTSFLCEQEPRVIVQYVNNVSALEFNVTYTQKQVQDMGASLIGMREEFQTGLNSVKESLEKQTQQTALIAGTQENLTAFTQEVKEDSDATEETNWFLIIVISVVVIGVVVWAAVAHKSQETKEHESGTY